jgi:FtsP/CotA-like multicopper oxidase with cupredoxin domain
MAAASASLPETTRALATADHTLEIAPCSVEVSPHRFFKTSAYNGQVPGPLLRLHEGVPVTIDVRNRTGNPEIVHFHGLFLPPEIDGAMEEGTPHIPPGGSARYTFTPAPSGLRWYHTHTFAGNNLARGLYSGQSGVLFVEPRDNPGAYDHEEFLVLQDWSGHLMGSDDGSMNAFYDVSTINGRVLGFGTPLRVRQGQRLLLHIVNASATDPHWIAFSGHTFHVIALDGNPVPTPQSVSQLRLAPAERVSALITLDNPGRWVLGEVRKHVQAAGMGIVIEYEGSSGKPVWQQPERLAWSYLPFGSAEAPASPDPAITEIPLVFTSRFVGHGAMDRWLINGKGYPQTETPVLHEGQRYRLLFKNRSVDDHPIHLHRHLFELRSFSSPSGSLQQTHGIFKDTVLVPAGSDVAVELTASHPGLTLLHCHQQDHMDMGFMMLFRYA